MGNEFRQHPRRSGAFSTPFFAALRYAVIAVPTILLVPRPTGRIGWLIGYGVTFGALQFGLLFVAIAVGMPAGLSSLVLQAAVPLTVALGVLLLGERLTIRRAAGVLAALAGLIAIGWERAEVAAIAPMLLTLAAAAALAVSNLCGRVAKPAEPLRFILWSSVVPPLPLLGMSWWLEGPEAGWTALLRAPTPDGWPGLAALLLVIIAGVLIGTAPTHTSTVDPEPRYGRARGTMMWLLRLARPSHYARLTTRPWTIR